MKADKGILDQMETKVIQSQRLGFILGEDGPVDITIRALPTKDIQYIQDFLTDKKGNVIPGRYLTANFMICTMGIIDPDISSPEIINHFETRDSKELVEKIFQAEAANIAVEIMKLSGADKDFTADIKN